MELALVVPTLYVLTDRRVATLPANEREIRHIFFPQSNLDKTQNKSVLISQDSNNIIKWKAHVRRGWPYQEDEPIWERSFWDHQLRNGDSYDVKWLYVRNNPVRHGLVKNADDWPFQGKVNDLAWHDR